MVIKNLENKIKLVMIICSLFLVGCIIICISSIWTAKQMVSDAHQKVYVLDGNVPILVQRSTMEETLDVEAKSHVEIKNSSKQTLMHYVYFDNHLYLAEEDHSYSPKYVVDLNESNCFYYINDKGEKVLP